MQKPLLSKPETGTNDIQLAAMKTERTSE